MDDHHQRLLRHIEHSHLVGIEGLEEEDIITGVVVLLRVERPDSPGSALITGSDADQFTALGMMHAAIDPVPEDD